MLNIVSLSGKHYAFIEQKMTKIFKTEIALVRHLFRKHKINLKHYICLDSYKIAMEKNSCYSTWELKK